MGEHSGLYAVLVDQDLFEDGLVDHASRDGLGFAVALCRVSGELERMVGDLLQLLIDVESDAHQLPCALNLLVKLVLLALELIEAHRVGGIRVKQLVAFAFDGVDPALESLGLTLVLVPKGLDVASNSPTNALDVLGADLNRLVVVHDRLIHAVHGDVLGRAVLTTPDTEEVGVLPPITGGKVEHHALPAIPTEDRALEVVVVGAPFLAGSGVRTHDLLNTIEGDLIDDRRMPPVLIDRPPEGHTPQVVLVAQQLVELVCLDLPAGRRSKP